MVKQVRAVIFDLGGTLVDPYSLTPLRALHNAFKKQHIYLTHHDINRYMGLDKKKHIQSLLMDYYRDIYRAPAKISNLDKKVEGIHKIFQEEHSNFITRKTDILPGAKVLHDLLREKDIKIGITTGYSFQEAEPIIYTLEEQGFTVDNVVTSDMVLLGRPYPDMIYENMKAFDIEEMDSSSVIKIDDSLPGIEEGRKAHVITIGVAKYSCLVGPVALASDETDRDVLDTRITYVKETMRDHYVDYAMDDLHDVHEFLERVL